MNRSVAWLLLSVACWCTAPSEARASCNSIAPASAVGSIVPPAATELPYRGAVGRIAHVYLAAGVTPEIIVGADPVCAATGGEEDLLHLQDSDGVGGINRDDVIVSVYYSPRDADAKKVRVQRYASPGLCETVAAADEQKASAFVPVAACANEGVTVEAAADGFRIHVPLREIADDLTGPLRVLVVKGGRAGPTRLEAADRALLAGDCAALRQRPATDGVYVCIDRIYRDGTGEARCAVAPQAADPWACKLVGLPPATSFGTQCTCACPDPASPECQCSASTCAGQATEMKWYVDTCGLDGIHAAFDWTKVLIADHGRGVVGFSAAGRDGEAQTSLPIAIPGREFVGSTGLPPNPPGDPRLPAINVLNDPSRPQEVGLIGVVDKPSSVLHIFPRFPVGQICRSADSQSEGCVAVAQSSVGGLETCPCDLDRQAMGCSCAAINPSQFFACRGGEFEGRPCTRPAHCGPGGVCDGHPSCQPRNSVWTKGAGLSKTNLCWTDRDCAAAQQCGYALFNSSDKRDSPSNATDRIVTLEHLVTPAGRNRRGVCPDNSSCSRTKQCGGANCIGYGLQARERVK